MGCWIIFLSHREKGAEMWVRALKDPSTRVFFCSDELWHGVTKGETSTIELFILWTGFGEDSSIVP